ncbi:short chain dehydrogenase [Shimia sp.]|mgnify:CR=1 FL=1|jgi:NAD(P)-dependent dehydrogenase (short-subunit alcohol dehydrogenase family)|uniref:short chain dehydrogenase n=1 Tax=unclassified Shimia TaxID=2630038 RepID=UPI0025D9D55A|nr:short chain dehydrogenase [Shimia sp.]MCH2067162.1 short chain dehydrogenase [Shimia sp.]
MKILLIGASGMIGRAVSHALSAGHDLITASRSSGDLHVDISDPASLRALFAKTGRVDAIISAAGDGVMAPLATMSDDDFNRTVDTQMKGQLNVLRLGLSAVAPGGSITLTSGVAAQNPMPSTSAIAASCAAIEAFTRTAATEVETVRLNVVSPIFVKESMELFGLPTDGGLSAADTAKSYLAAVAGDMHGQILATPDFA